jgi:hypothetical protein
MKLHGWNEHLMEGVGADTLWRPSKAKNAWSDAAGNAGWSDGVQTLRSKPYAWPLRA